MSLSHRARLGTFRALGSDGLTWSQCRTDSVLRYMHAHRRAHRHASPLGQTGLGI